MLTADLRILVAGSGGQGVLFLGKLLCYSAMLSDLNTTWFPSYGAEMRGGTANCTVVISNNPIGSPVVKIVDILVALNAQSLKKFLSRVRSQGAVFSLCNTEGLRDDVTFYNLKQLSSCQQDKAINMLFAGAVIKYAQFCSLDTAIEAVKEISAKYSAEIVKQNIELLKKGYDLI